MNKNWAHGVSGDYAVAANWNPASLPFPTDDIKIQQAGSYTVTLGGVSTPGINSLRVAQPAGSSVELLVEQATLGITGDVFNSGKLATDNSGRFNIGGDLRNSGNVQLKFGTLHVTGGLVNTGNVGSFFIGGQLYVGGVTRNLVDDSDPAHVKTGSISAGNTGANFEFAGQVINAASISVTGGSLGHGEIATSGGTMLMDAGLTNKGTVTVDQASRLTVHGDTVNTGSITVGNDSTLSVGNLNNKGTLTETGVNFTTSPITTGSSTGDVTNSGSIQLQGGSKFTVGGALNNSGSITATGNVQFLGGFGPIHSFPSTLEVHGDARNTDTITASNSGLVLFDQAVTNLADGTILGDQSGHVEAIGAVTNKGTIKSNASSLVELKSTVANTGDLIADNATLDVTGGVTGNGTIQIMGTGSVDLAAGSTNHIEFSGAAGGHLILHDAPDVHGNIAGFADTDTIDFKDFMAGSTTVQYTSNNAHTRGTLLLTDQSDPSHTASIAIVGSYAQGNFSPGDDGSGHLLIHFNV